MNQIDFCFLEGRRDLVLYNLNLGPIADNLIAIFQRGSAPNFQTDG